MKISSSLKRAFALLLLIPLLGLGCKAPSKAAQEASKSITLKFWGVFDDTDAYATIMQDYKKLHPNIKIEYRKFRSEEYDRELLNAFAEDRGPDIFMVHNTAVREWLPKLTPVPPTMELAYFTVQGSIKKETVVELKKTRGMTASDMRRDFAEVVGKDAIISTLVDERTGAYADKIYGIPMSIDTMVLYYNKDLFNTSGIALPPKNWDEFQSAVEKITRVDAQGNIVQSAAAIGTSRNIERASDLVSLLMMQTGAKMTDDVGRAIFQTIPTGLQTKVPPSVEAARFYTDFANPNYKTYTWNASMPNSLEAFATGKTAMFFGYAYHLPLIKARAPKLNFDLTSMPQLTNEGSGVNFANYWLLSVAKKSKNPAAAWDFIHFATKANNVGSYLTATRKPTALRSLLDKQKEDPVMSMFANQILTAQSWYRGKDSLAAEEAMMNLIDETLTATEETILIPIETAVAKINQTLR